MRGIAVLFAGFVLSLALGLSSAWMALRSPAPIDAIKLGAWQAWPNAGTADADPYSRARLARTGEIPLGSGEGLALLAQTDDLGGNLKASCDYRIVGQTPPARLWTIAVEDLGGHVVQQGDTLAALGSDVLLRSGDGSFEIALSANPKPGNWISTRTATRFRVTVRLYDTAARTVTALTTLTMPRVVRGRCTT